jgi:hypothetical protein
MQTSHNIFPKKGLPGEIADAKDGYDIITCIAAEDLQFGRFVELASSDDALINPIVQLCQQTGATMAIVGIVCRDEQRENNIWPANTALGVKAGSRVSVMRRGRIFAERDTADTVAVTRFLAHNVMHSSTVSTNRGKVTLAATSTGAGTEITASTVSQLWKDVTAASGGAANTDVALVEIYVK